MSRVPDNGEDPRLAEMLDVIFRFAAGDLKARGTLSAENGSLDGVMAGINILGEELEAYVSENREVNDSLRQALDLTQALIRSSPGGIIAVDRDLRITECNLVMEQMVGMPAEQVRGRILDEIPFMRETGEAARMGRGIEEPKLERREIAYELPGSGEGRAYESIMAPLAGASGQVQGMVLVVLDVTERKRAEDRLRSISLYVRSLIEASLDPLVTISVEGTITDVNEATTRATGVARERLIGSDFSEYFTDPSKARAGYQEVFTDGPLRNYPLTIRHASGKATDVLYNASPYRDENGEVAGVLVVARDLTERKRAERAEDRASRDSLTQLFNHRTFYALLDEEIIRTRRFGRSVSLLMVDIDGFKLVNDTHGHLAGDAIIRRLSDLLVTGARAVDRVCRYGGEEFTLILPETVAPVAMALAERLRTGIERQSFEIGGGETLSITVSIGVASCPQHADSTKGLVEAADIALYRAKEGGRNRCSQYG